MGKRKPKRLKKGAFTLEALLDAFDEAEEDALAHEEKELDTDGLIRHFMVRQSLELCEKRGKPKYVR